MLLALGLLDKLFYNQKKIIVIFRWFEYVGQKLKWHRIYATLPKNPSRKTWILLSGPIGLVYHCTTDDIQGFALIYTIGQILTQNFEYLFSCTLPKNTASISTQGCDRSVFMI